MYAFRRKILINAFKLFDLMNMSICLIFSFFAVSDSVAKPELYSIGQVEIKILSLGFFLMALFTWYLIFLNLKLYHSRRLSAQSEEILDVLKATSIGAVIILGEATFLRVNSISIQVILVFWICSTIIAVASRILLRYFLRWVRVRGRNLRHVLIIGTNSRAIQLGDKLSTSPALGYHLIGFVDDEWVGFDGLKKTGCRLVCDLNGFQAFIRNCVVDEVVVALPLKTLYDQASKIISICEEQGVIVRCLPNIFHANCTISNIDYFDQDYLLPVSYISIHGYKSLIKRVIDIVFSSVVLIVSVPIFIIVSMAVKLTSRGPVFFIQERVGLNKRVFQLFKFRTMVMDAEEKQAELESLNEACGPVFKICDDPRITSIGKFLRQTSIDELPQLINVLRGDMSIVGPRPLPVRDYNGFSEDWHRRRFSVKPGITCLWQVNGRSKIPFDKWMELDMEYIDQWSFWLDIKILAKTITTVLKGTGAS